MSASLRVLFAAGSRGDADLIVGHLRKTFDRVSIRHADTAAAMEAALREESWDIVISDFTFRDFDSHASLAMLRQSTLRLPFFVVSGGMSEQDAAELLKSGAHSILMKDQLAQLPAAVDREIRSARTVREPRQPEPSAAEISDRMKIAAEVAALGFWEWDPKSRRLEWDETMYRIFQIPPSAPALYDAWMGSIHPEDVPAVQEMLQRAGTADDISLTEYRIIHPDKTVHQIHTHHLARKDATGGVSRVIGVAQDVTRRKAMEDRMRTSEVRYRRLFESAQDGILILNADSGHILDVNPHLIEMLGYPREDFLGKEIWDLAVFKDIAGTKEQFRRLRAKGFVRYEDLPLRTGSGTILHVEFVSNLYLADDQSVIQCHLRDIMDRKEAEEALRNSEQRLRILFEHAPDAILLMDSHGTILDINRTAVRMIEYTKEELAGRSVKDLNLLSEPELDMARQLKTAMIAGSSTGSAEFLLATKQGRTVPVEVRTYPIEVDGQQLVLAIARDITQRKSAEAKILKLQRTYMVLSSINELIVRERNRKKLLEQACRVAVEVGGLKMTWVGMIDEKSRMLVPIAYAGGPTSYLEHLEVPLPGNAEGGGPMQTAVREGHGVVLNDIEKDEAMGLWSRRAAASGFRSCASFPLRVGLRTVGGIDFYASEGQYFDKEEVEVLAELAMDISFALETIEIEERRIITERALVRDERRLMSLWKLSQMEASSVNDYLDQGLEEVLLLTESKIGYLYQYDEERKELRLSCWSQSLRDTADTSQARTVLPLESTPSLAEAVRQRRALIENAVGPATPALEGYPDGIPRPERLMTVPIIQGESVVAIVGVAEKESYYDDADAEQCALIMDSVLKLVAQREAEEALSRSNTFNELLLQAMPFGIDIVDEAGAVLFMSDKMRNLSREDAIGKRCWHVYRDDRTQCAQCPLHREIEVGKHEVTEASGVFGGRTFQISHIGIMYEGRKALLEIFQDITEQKRLEREMLQAQRIQGLGTLAGGIAHDFNNILGIIMAYTAFLKPGKKSDAEIKEGLEVVTNAVNRGAALVRQILTFARQTEVAISPMSFKDLIREIIPMLKETFPRTIDLHEVIEPDLPFISADHSQMHQTLLNLCINARDAMPNGGTLTIEARAVTKEQVQKRFPAADQDRYVCLRVIDTGIGMDETIRTRIFDPFFTTKEQGKGTGLGLSVVYGIVESHHGFIDVESEVGKGSVFSLFFPVPAAGDQEPEREEVEEEADPYSGSETILVVEDEKQLLDMLCTFISSSGYSVLTATDGEQAIEMFTKHHKEIALVLTDMGLPKKSGAEVLQAMRKLNPKVKVIVMSGFLEPEMRNRLASSGMSGFLQKPGEPTDILRTIREVLDAS